MLQPFYFSHYCNGLSRYTKTPTCSTKLIFHPILSQWTCPNTLCCAQNRNNSISYLLISIFSPEPIYAVIGSYGNLYKLSFSKDSISCSCDYNYTFPCKHILYILHAINYKTRIGQLQVFLYEILECLNKTSLSHLCLDPRTESLCASQNANECRCVSCNYFLEGSLSICYHCARPFH